MEEDKPVPVEELKLNQKFAMMVTVLEIVSGSGVNGAHAALPVEMELGKERSIS